MSEFVLPFHVPAPVGGQGNVTSIREEGINAGEAEIELVVLSGGPVFLWQGRETRDVAQSGATQDPQDYDLAATAALITRARLGVGTYTVWAAQETYGFIKLVEK
jgi:hypothetical protein